MALVLSSKAAAQQGKLLLQQALDDFRSVLKDEEKLRLDSSKAAGMPDASSIMALTSEIDQTQASRTSRRIGPRLQPFLTGIQQICGVMDTLAQLHPIAVAAWGAVKLTLLLTSNFGTYFEKLAELLNDIGKRAPSYQEFAVLYGSSDTLQDALCGYYAVIVRLCQQVVKVSRRKGVFQVPRAALVSFEHDFDPLRKQIDDASEEVNIQIQIATSRVQMQEAKLNQLEREKSDDARRLLAKFSSQAETEYLEMKRWREEQDLHRLRRDKQIFREQLSTIDHTLPWRQARKSCTPDTAIWFRDESTYTDWEVADASGLLLLSGALGSGKTIVAANIIADLNDMKVNASGHCQVAYFFCMNERPASLNSRNIFGSIALQLFDDIISRADRPKFESLRSSCKTFSDVDTIIAFIASNLEKSGRYFIVLDGVDQANSNLSDILACLDDLIRLTPKSFKIKILLSTRPGMSANISNVFESPFSLFMSSSHVEKDLELFVNSTLIEKVDSGELRLTDWNILEGIRDFLLVGSQGMFLWTKLLLEEICMCSTDEKIISCLTAVPLKLADIYHRILNTVLSSSLSETILCLLQWVVGATRPLKTLEILEALTLAPGQTKFQTEKLLHNIKEPVFATRGLVFIDEDEETLHLVHHSLKQALVDYTRRDEPPVPSFEQDELDLRLGHLCMTYLLFENFNRQVAKTSSNTASFDVSNLALQLSESTMMSKSMTKTAMSILQKSRNRDSKAVNSSSRSFDVEKKLRDMAENMSKTRRTHHGHNECQHLLNYAASAWSDHTKAISASSDAWALFMRIAESHDGHISRPWEKCPDLTWYDRTIKHLVTTPSKLHAMIIEWADRHAHHGLVELSFPRAYIGTSSTFMVQNRSGWAPADRRQFEKAIFRTVMQSKEHSIRSLVYRLMDNPIFDVRYQSLIAIVFDFPLTSPMESSASYTGGVFSRDVEPLRQPYSISNLIEDFGLTVLDQTFYNSRQDVTRQLQSNALSGICLEWSDMAEFSGLQSAERLLAIDQSLSSSDLAIMFGREKIYATIFECFKNSANLREHLGLALVYGREKMVETIFNVVKPVTPQFHCYQVALSMLQGFSSLTRTMTETEPLFSRDQEIGDLLRLAWYKKMPEVFKNLLSVAMYRDIVLYTRPNLLRNDWDKKPRSPKLFPILQQEKHESLRDYIIRLKDKDPDQKQMEIRLSAWESGEFYYSPSEVASALDRVMDKNAELVQRALSRLRTDSTPSAKVEAMRDYALTFEIMVTTAEALEQTHEITNRRPMLVLREVSDKLLRMTEKRSDGTSADKGQFLELVAYIDKPFSKWYVEVTTQAYEWYHELSTRANK